MAYPVQSQRPEHHYDHGQSFNHDHATISASMANAQPPVDVTDPTAHYIVPARNPAIYAPPSTPASPAL